MDGVRGVPGQHVPKPVEQDHRTGNELVKVAMQGKGIVPDQMRRSAIVTHKNVLVTKIIFFKKCEK